MAYRLCSKTMTITCTKTKKTYIYIYIHTYISIKKNQWKKKTNEQKRQKAQIKQTVTKQ